MFVRTFYIIIGVMRDYSGVMRDYELMLVIFEVSVASSAKDWYGRRIQ
jgi:hypothetical protein